MHERVGRVEAAQLRVGRLEQGELFLLHREACISYAPEETAQANVIRRREETAATRSLLNTAKVTEDSPVALRLKELETLETSRRRSTSSASPVVWTRSWRAS